MTTRPRHPSRPDGHYSLVDAELVTPVSRRSWPSERPTARSEDYGTPELTPPPTARTRGGSVPPMAKGLPVWLVAIGVIVGPGGATALVQGLRADPSTEIAPKLDAIEKRLGTIEDEQRESGKAIGRIESRHLAEDQSARETAAELRSYLSRSRDPEARKALGVLERAQ